MVQDTHVCEEDHSKYLDNFIRKIIHNPQKMFRHYINAGDTVMDIGCGPGTFTIDLAKMVTKQGKVIGVDLQEGMLNRAKNKAQKNDVLDTITFHQCQSNKIGIEIKADFILTFFMVHETPDPIGFINEVCTLIKPGGYYYLAEPAFHVSKRQYEEINEQCIKNGLKIIKKSGVISRISVFQRSN